MSGFWSKIYWTHLAGPADARPIFRAILGGTRRRLLEIGVGDAERASKMVQVAAASGPVRYLGVDLFEARGANHRPGTTLKLALGRLTTTGAEIRLAPGEPAAALARLAALRDNDLVVVASEFVTEDPHFWRAISSMTTDNAAIFVERTLESGGSKFERMEAAEARRLATRRAA